MCASDRLYPATSPNPHAAVSDTTIAATAAAPTMPSENTTRPQVGPSTGVNARAISGTVSSGFAAAPASAAAAVISTAAMIAWVMTAPAAVSIRADFRCFGPSPLSMMADC